MRKDFVTIQMTVNIIQTHREWYILSLKRRTPATSLSHVTQTQINNQGTPEGSHSSKREECITQEMPHREQVISVWEAFLGND